MEKHKRKTGYPKGVSYEQMFGVAKANSLKKTRSDFMKKNSPMFKEENKKKLSKLYTGRKLSEETCRKLSESKKGKSPKNIKLLEETGTKTRFKKGMIPWNKGLTKENNNSVRNISINLIGEKNPHYGIPRTKEQKEEARLRWLGRKHTEVSKKKMSIARMGVKRTPKSIAKYKIWRRTQIMPIKDTKIEIKIQKLLSQLHLEYLTHKYISEITHGYQCDILIPTQEGIPQKTVIECDGCYWHGCNICNLKPYDKLEERKELDKNRTEELIKKGFRVIRLWEHDINNMNLDELKKELVITI